MAAAAVVVALELERASCVPVLGRRRTVGTGIVAWGRLDHPGTDNNCGTGTA